MGAILFFFDVVLFFGFSCVFLVFFVFPPVALAIVVFTSQKPAFLYISLSFFDMLNSQQSKSQQKPKAKKPTEAKRQQKPKRKKKPRANKRQKAKRNQKANRSQKPTEAKKQTEAKKTRKQQKTPSKKNTPSFQNPSSPGSQNFAGKTAMDPPPQYSKMSQGSLREWEVQDSAALSGPTSQNMLSDQKNPADWISCVHLASPICVELPGLLDDGHKKNHSWVAPRIPTCTIPGRGRCNLWFGWDQ